MTEFCHVSHGFPPVFDADCRVLILGSFPSVRSRAASFYYAHPQNRFYKVLDALLGEVPPDTDGRRAYLLAHHIALWDVIEECDISGSSDASVRNAVPTAVAPLLAGSAVRAILLNGKLAGKYYEKYQRAGIPLPHFILPSTSPANAAFDLAALCAAWGEKLLPYLNSSV